MSEPDTTKQKQKREGDKTANVAHIVTPDPDEDPGTPKLPVREAGPSKVDASPKSKDERRKDTGPLHLGVNFNASE